MLVCAVCAECARRHGVGLRHWFQVRASARAGAASLMAQMQMALPPARQV
jgi:hypothetical protein